MGVGPGRRENAAPRPFVEFSPEPNIVLLGDPGAGKTHLFRAAAAAEHARFVHRPGVPEHAGRRVTRTRAVYRWPRRKARRARRSRYGRCSGGESFSTSHRQRCGFPAGARTGSVKAILRRWRPYFDQQGGAVVLHLESLSQDEQLAVLAEQKCRAELRRYVSSCEAAERGLGDFLENPQNLIMLWRAVQTGSWPRTRKGVVRAFDRAHAPGVQHRAGARRQRHFLGCGIAAGCRRVVRREVDQRRRSGQLDGSGRLARNSRLPFDGFVSARAGAGGPWQAHIRRGVCAGSGRLRTPHHG